MGACLEKLIIVASDKAGVYAKISIALVRRGITVTARSVEKIGDGLSQFILTIKAPDNLIIPTVQQLKIMDGVVAVEIMGSPLVETLLEPTQPPPRATEKKVVPSLQASRVGILEELIYANPDIVGIVREYTNSLNQEEAPVKLRELGQRFGEAVTTIDMTQPLGSIGFACDEFIIPLISEFSFIERHDEDLAISLCPFCRNSSQKIQHCSFMHGIITGIIKSCPEWSNADVIEKSSQAGGYAECVFGIEL